MFRRRWSLVAGRRWWAGSEAGGWKSRVWEVVVDCGMRSGCSCFLVARCVALLVAVAARLAAGKGGGTRNRLSAKSDS